jgi:hypothetical protein
MKTLRLDIDYDFDFAVFGLVSSSKEYKLAWALNKCLKLHLVKQADLCFDFISKGRLVISNYLHLSESSSFRLFRNKSVDLSTLKKPFLVPDIKEYDYVVQVSGVLSDCQQEMLHLLNCVPVIQYVQPFDPNHLKFKENLIF